MHRRLPLACSHEQHTLDASPRKRGSSLEARIVCGGQPPPGGIFSFAPLASSMSGSGEEAFLFVEPEFFVSGLFPVRVSYLLLAGARKASQQAIQCLLIPFLRGLGRHLISAC